MARRTADDDVTDGAGHPRLVLAAQGHAAAGSPQANGIEQAFTLVSDVVTLGSDDSQDIRVPGLEPRHGEIRREPDEDEYVYVARAGASRVAGSVVSTAGLHHGDRLELGEVTFVFQRDEFADHGRPDGGREGGDFAGGHGAGGGGDATELG